MDSQDKDQMITKLKKENLRLMVVIGTLMICCLISFVYAFVQKGIADEMQCMANMNAQEATRQRVIAEKVVEAAREQAKMAEQAAETARQTMQKALKK